MRVLKAASKAKLSVQDRKHLQTFGTALNHMARGRIAQLGALLNLKWRSTESECPAEQGQPVPRPRAVRQDRGPMVRHWRQVSPSQPGGHQARAVRASRATTPSSMRTRGQDVPGRQSEPVRQCGVRLIPAASWRETMRCTVDQASLCRRVRSQAGLTVSELPPLPREPPPGWHGPTSLTPRENRQGEQEVMQSGQVTEVQPHGSCDRRSRSRRRATRRGRGRSQAVRSPLQRPGHHGQQGQVGESVTGQQPVAPCDSSAAEPSEPRDQKPWKVLRKESADRAQSLSESQRLRDEIRLQQASVPWYVMDRIQKRADRRAQLGEEQAQA